MECSCSENECKTCGEFKTRSFEFNITRVRGLNKPFTRSGIALDVTYDRCYYWNSDIWIFCN